VQKTTVAGKGAAFGRYLLRFDRWQSRQFSRSTTMTFGDVCVLLMVLFAFATLILKVVEVKRHK
jgi:hypothetical protein